MPSFNLPASPFREATALPPPEPALPPAPALKPATPDHPPSPVPVAEEVSFARKVFAALARLQASFARAEAVHQSRLDAGWTGPGWHLLAHYTCSVK